ncbi:Outer membrane porin F precursor [Nonomuraea coxensis DSM 45129]|uniref:Outer membrane porin F n=1 Tax=Nonomuraea coxensis DSM 45129 TaxID=1122611 RepID=A0ABX8TVS9_9ACTN|nr:OmpA family protein [Nonomuraea coxensis]QYC39054.1 Outer membrane porin F precursor [Nonomuraea coxensis DSM 45129]
MPWWGSGRRITILASAVTVVAILAGCSAGDGIARPPASASPPSAPAASTAASGAPAPLATLRAGGDGDGSGTGRIDVVALERTTPDTVTARLRISAERGEVDLGQFRPPAIAGTVAYNYTASSAGFFLLDEPRLSLYFAMKRDAEKTGAACLCTQLSGKLTVTSEPAQVWIVYRVPVETASVAVGLMSVGVTAPLPIGPRGQAAAPDEPGPAAVAAAFPNTRGLATSLSGAAEKVAETTDKVEIALDTDVLFDFDKASLTSKAQATLRSTAERIRRQAAGTVRIVGHTDDVGDDTYNMRLSRRRAQAVEQALRASGAGRDLTFQVEGRGEREPKEQGSSEAARAVNRRVEVSYPRPVAAAPATPAVPRPEESPSVPATTGATAAGLRSMEGVTADLVELRRLSPTTLIATFDFRNEGSREIAMRDGAMDRDAQRSSGTAHIAAFEFFWLSLADAAGNRYYVLRTSGRPVHHCLCSELDKLPPGGRVRTFALMTSPPPDVRTVDVGLFAFEPMRGVPIA